MAYSVQTPVYEGPFDLLLHLILREQVDLYEVSLWTIVDGYLAELARMERLDLDVATEFVLIAATLLELKTRRLLPDETDGDLDEEIALWEERDLLLARLLECKTFKDAAEALALLSDLASLSAPRRLGPEERFAALAPDILERVSVEDLRAACIRALTPKPVPTVDTDHITYIRLSVADAVIEVADELRRAGRISFRELTAGLTDRIEIVVRFLAILELFKQGTIDIDQVTSFGDLQVFWVASDAHISELVSADAYDG